ncbi:MAG TPA: hypothetical protein VM451_05855 [Candidatus Limnocylindria bacterium]|nr:hypothetical protein [Candidatus Limnocylindria bacterium]
MSRRRWSIWLGPPIAVAIVAVALIRLQAGAEAGGKATPVAAGACAESPLTRDADGKVSRGGAKGAWWRLTERLDGKGFMIGRALVLGQGGAVRVALQLRSETLASGPVGGVVALTTDDGSISEIRLVSIAKACSWTVHQAMDLVRGAFVDPSDGSVVAHLLDRSTREDLGTWRVAATGGDPTLVLAPLPPAALGRVFSTDYRLDAAGRRLAVQSCSDLACITRIVDLADPSRAVITIDGQQGQIVGFAGGRLVTWAQCVGLPCGVLAWDFAARTSTEIVDRAESAAVTEDGEFLLAVKDSIRNRTIRVAVGRGGEVAVKGVSRDEQVLSGGVTGFAGYEGNADEVALAIPNGTPHAFRPSAAEVLP